MNVCWFVKDMWSIWIRRELGLMCRVCVRAAGLPVSTTQVLCGAIFAIGLFEGGKGLNWRVALKVCPHGRASRAPEGRRGEEGGNSVTMGSMERCRIRETECLPIRFKCLASFAVAFYIGADCTEWRCGDHSHTCAVCEETGRAFPRCLCHAMT